MIGRPAIVFGKIMECVRVSGVAGLHADEALAQVPEATIRTVRTMLSRAALTGNLYAVGYRATRRYFGELAHAAAYAELCEAKRADRTRTLNRECKRRHYVPKPYRKSSWPDEQIAELRALYPANQAAVVAESLGRTVWEVYKMAHALKVKRTPPAKAPKPPKVAAPKQPRKAKVVALKAPKALPAHADPGPRTARPARGPAHLDGPLIFTPQTIRIVHPTPPRELKSNTHNFW